MIQSKTTMLFDDGKRRVDFVLVRPITVDDRKVHKRLVFENNLMRQGVDLELQEDTEDNDDKYRYIKLHMTRPLLKYMAEFMQMKMPIHEDDLDTSDNVSMNMPSNCLTHNLDLIPMRQKYFVAPFKMHRLDIFLTVNKEVFIR